MRPPVPSASAVRTSSDLHPDGFLEVASGLDAGDERDRVIARLRGELRAIERAPQILGRCSTDAPATWTTGAERIDAALGPAGLDPGGVHEIRPEASGDWPAVWGAAQSFALLLASQRMRSSRIGARPLLWCPAPGMSTEIGLPYLPGLAALDVGCDRVLLVLPRRADEVLWVLEESLKSEALAVAIGALDTIALTPARRLSLAAAAHATPCLVLTDPRRSPTPAAATRWAVGPAASGPHPLSSKAPGPPRFLVRLERNRDRPLSAPVEALIEWCHEAYCFHMAADVADRTDAARAAGDRAGWRRAG